jgi:hypothetical protein
VHTDLLSNWSSSPVAWKGALVKAGSVRLSRKSRAPEPVPRRAHHPWHPPEAELPGAVLVDTLHFDRSELAAVAITGISAYAKGFEFTVARRIRPGTPGLDEEFTPEMRRRMLTQQDPFQISVQFSDGRKAISSTAHGDSEPTEPILQRRGGGGSSHSQRHHNRQQRHRHLNNSQHHCRYRAHPSHCTRRDHWPAGTDARVIRGMAAPGVRPCPGLSPGTRRRPASRVSVARRSLSKEASWLPAQRPDR